jgi:hypothetical protein
MLHFIAVGSTYRSSTDKFEVKNYFLKAIKEQL